MEDFLQLERQLDRDGVQGCCEAGTAELTGMIGRLGMYCTVHWDGDVVCSPFWT